MSKKVSIRIISDYGRNALQLTMDSKLHEIRSKAAEVLKCKNSEITLTIAGKRITESDNFPLCKVKNIKAPVTVINATANTSNDEMMIEEKKPMGQSSLLNSTLKTEPKPDMTKPRCSCGPKGKCVICIDDKSKTAFQDPKKAQENNSNE